MKFDEMLNGIKLSSKNIVLPSRELLNNISFKCSVRKSTNDLKVDSNILSMVISDARTYETVIRNMNLLDGYTYRVKTPDSIERKIESCLRKKKYKKSLI